MFSNADHVIELDLPNVSKQSFWLTGFSLLLLFSLKILVERSFSFAFSFAMVAVFIIGYVVLIVLHEFFHLFGFRFFAKVPWKKMKVGLNLKLGVAYATTVETMTNSAVRKALLLPFWMTGILPALYGLCTGNGVVLVLAAFLIGGAAGDFAMYKELKRFPDHWLVKDDPELPKLYVFERELK